MPVIVEGIRLSDMGNIGRLKDQVFGPDAYFLFVSLRSFECAASVLSLLFLLFVQTF